MIRKFKTFFLSCCLLISTASFAGALQISPIRLQLTNPQGIATLKLKNKSDLTLYLQLETKQWAQQKGQDQYANTKDILLTPPMIMLAPDESQLVRVALRHPIALQSEAAYRVYIQEIPAANSDQSVGINFNLRFGIPLFVNYKPVAAFNKDQIDWRLFKKNHDLHIQLKNKNAVHVQLTHLTLGVLNNKGHVISESIFHYLLPNQSIDLTYPLKILPDKKLSVLIDTDQGLIRAHSD